MAAVRFARPDQVNLLGYLLRSILQRGATHPAGQKALRRLRGSIEIGGSDMRIRLESSGGEAVISAGPAPEADARVHADLRTLLELALGKNPLGPFFRGRLRVRGKIWRLLPLLRLMKGPRQP